MRKLPWILVALLLSASSARAAMTSSASKILTDTAYITSGNSVLNPLYKFANEVEAMMEASTSYPFPALYFGKTDTAPTASEGMVYFDDSENCLKFYSGSAWVALTTGTGDNTLDDAYDQGGAGAGKAITVDTGALAFTATNAANNTVMILTQQDTAASTTLQLVGSQATANAIALDIDGQSTGRDIEGTGATWYVTGAGAATFTSATIPTLTVSTTLTASSGITLDSADTITNSTNTEIKFADTGGEDFIFDLDAASNTVGLKSSTGVTGLAMGDVDALSGVESIAFDAAASSISLASDGAADDLTIQVTGAQNSSLVLASSGTAEDALTISTSAGGMNITVAGAAANEDLDLTSDSSINLTATEADAAAITLTSTGGIDLTSSATYDIDITATGGKVLATGNENAAGAISLLTSGGGGTSETIVITNDQGTGEDSLNIDATAGGIDVDAAAAKDINIAGGQVALVSKDNAASAIALTANVGVSETIVVTNTQGTGEAAITLTSTAGGVDVDAAAAKDLDLAGGQVKLVSKDNAASAISLTANIGASETIVVTNTQGTSEAAITLTSTAGGVDVDAAAAKDLDLAGGQVKLTSKDNAASAIALLTNIGSSETITVTNTQGTNAAAIGLTSSAGGITLSVATGKAITLTGTTAVTQGSNIASPAGAELTLGDGNYFLITGTNNITSIAAASAVTGRIVVLRFAAILTFTDGGNLKLAGNLVTTADDMITLICDTDGNWYEVCRSVN